MERLFGTEVQSRVLVLLGMLESSYPTELARLSGGSYTAVVSYIDRLEADGIIVAATQGRNRRVSINPRYKARRELVELLKTIGSRSPEIQQALASLRRRPRKKGKAIWKADSE